MSTFALRSRFVDIARRDVGKTEVTRNRADWIKPYWPATSYPEGWVERAPYCAAAMCRWKQLWLGDPEVLGALGKTAIQAERWRCKSAAAFGWEDWAEAMGVRVLKRNAVLHTADIMVFNMSHIGLVTDDAGQAVFTIEANTGATGGRDGDGCFAKTRSRSLARCFIRLLD